MGLRGIPAFFSFLRGTFPVQLMLVHLKKNQVLLLFWVFLFGFILFDWGKLFGIPYLFLDPEYQGRVSVRSLFVLGLAFGVFHTSFQITCYILDSHRFRLLTGARKAIDFYTLNNGLLPLAYLLVFCIRFWTFQVERGLEDRTEATLETLAFTGGFLWIFLLTHFYFRFTRSRPLRHLAGAIDRRLRNLSFFRLSLWKRLRSFRDTKARVRHFIDDSFRVKQVRETDKQAHRDPSHTVFSSDHLAAVILEVGTILLLVFLGIFNERPLLQIPAAASIFLFFAFIQMLIGALSYWLRGWSISVFLLTAILVNSLFSSGVLERQYPAFGLDYSKKVPYNNPRIRAMAEPVQYVKDSLSTIAILEKWKEKQSEPRPIMVINCTSGGGIRSATWTMRTLHYADSCLRGGLMQHTALITGASGGLLGAAYYRELFLQSKIQDDSAYLSRRAIDNIARDILNPVVFSLVTNDLIIRLRHFNDGKYEYSADRGLVFDNTLHKNLGNALRKNLYHYANPERQALIPLLFITPVIVNDGRRLYISPQPISYMTWDKNVSLQTPDYKLVRGIEMTRYFEKCDAMRLSFASALRMNATFPYITPNVGLPATPSIEVMDGGLSDNFGISDALKFVHTFKPWIEAHTAGVLLLCIRDTPRERPFRKKTNDSWFSRILNPVGSVYANWARNQDYNNDQQTEYLRRSMNVPLESVTFQYLAPGDLVETLDESKAEGRASLSWHLTTFEKAGIEASIHNPRNQEALNRLKRVLIPPLTGEKSK